MADGNGLSDNKNDYRLSSHDTTPAAGERSVHGFTATGPDGGRPRAQDPRPHPGRVIDRHSPPPDPRA
ncbi:hypothetical protein ACFXPY_18220, partial [Streptomyces sp. NPDC059153]